MALQWRRDLQHQRDCLGGFDRDDVGTEVFGKGGNEASFFADMDNDNDLDIIHATEDNGRSIYVYLNKGDNSFENVAIATTGMTASTGGQGIAGETNAEQGWLRDANAESFDG